MPAPELPRHAARATRSSGRKRRTELLDAAGALFAERGLGGVSVSEIAERADAFPSQVTYYFGSKEALFVESACREALHAASEVERAGSRARTPRSYVAAIVATALAAPALPNFIAAMLLVRRRPQLAPLVERTLSQLHAEGARAVRETLERRGWTSAASPDLEARAFWAAVLGVVLERSALGDAFDPAGAEAAVRLVLKLDGPEAGAPPGSAAPGDSSGVSGRTSGRGPSRPGR